MEVKDRLFGLYGKYRGTVVVDLPTGIRHYLYDTPWHKNLIVDNGRTWLMSRGTADSAVLSVKSLGIGTGTTAPLLSQSALVTQTARANTTNSTAGDPTWQMIFTATFTAAQINTTTEIGVFNATSGGTMIARSTHTALQVPPGSSVVMQYVIGITTAKTPAVWTLTSGVVWETADSVLCNGVLEMDTGNGYLKKTSVATVQAQAGSYWHDSGANKTYIHCTDGLDPATHNVIVISEA